MSLFHNRSISCNSVFFCAGLHSAGGAAAGERRRAEHGAAARRAARAVGRAAAGGGRGSRAGPGRDAGAGSPPRERACASALGRSHALQQRSALPGAPALGGQASLASCNFPTRDWGLHAIHVVPGVPRLLFSVLWQHRRMSFAFKSSIGVTRFCSLILSRVICTYCFNMKPPWLTALLISLLEIPVLAAVEVTGHQRKLHGRPALAQSGSVPVGRSAAVWRVYSGVPPSAADRSAQRRFDVPLRTQQVGCCLWAVHREGGLASCGAA